MFGRRIALLAVTFLVGCGSSSTPVARRPVMVAASAPAVERVPATAPVEEDGLEDHQIRQVVEAKNGAVRGCHTLEYVGRGAEERAHTGGTVTVDLEINPDGTVASAEITESDFDSQPMHECVLDITRNLRFPTAPGSTELSWRFRFRGQS
jgi:TonB family protein